MDVLQVGHPLGLSLAEPRDLAVLGLPGREVGEREAGEKRAVNLERRRSHQDRNSRAADVHEIELDRGADPARSRELLQLRCTPGHELRQRVSRERDRSSARRGFA
jgi:hypothetical protein